MPFMLNQELVTNALKSVKYPGYTRDIVSFGIVKNIAVNGGAVSVSLQLTGGTPLIAQQIKADAEKTLRALPGVEQLHVEIAGSPAAAPAQVRGRRRTRFRASSAPWPWPAAKAGWASPPFRSIWPAHCGISARKSVCWIATFTGRAFR